MNLPLLHRKRCGILVSLLAFAAMASATTSISRTGSCSAAGATSCTFSATKTGDLKIVFAYRNASTTAPTLPTGWTNIANGSEGSSGTTAAYRIGCNNSSSSSDTGTGSWTNANDVVGISYSGTLSGSTSACATTGIGGKVFTGAQTSTTAAFTTIAMTNSNGSSWVAGFLGNSAGGLCTPSGMSSVSTAGSGPAVIGNDTSGAASGWATTNCTVTSSTWITYVLEILGTPGHFIHVQGVSAQITSAGTTATMTLGTAPTPGDLLVAGVVTFATSTTFVSSLVCKDSNNNALTFTPNSPDSPASGASQGVQSWVGYILSAPANIQASFVCTWTTSAIFGGDLDEFAGGNGAVVLFDNDTKGGGTTAGTTVNTPTLKPGASNELAYIVANGSVSITAPAQGAKLGSWTGSGGAILSDATMSEYALNISSSTAAQLTQSSGTWSSMGATFQMLVPRLTLLGVGP